MGIVIGVTGGIATGKTTVARMFEHFGAECVDADEVAREVLSAGSEAAEEVRVVFGPKVMDSQGAIDRAKLANIIFADSDARERLNRITHPRIIKILNDKIRAFRDKAGPNDVLALEIPLLVEANLTGIVDKVIVVTAEQETQKNRLQKRSALTAEQAERRIGSQMPACRKADYADWTISGEGPLSETESQVRAVWEQIAQTSEPQG
ncbi:MAG: dephospho-CoA kinase [Armatimonadota bacterium]|nr:dephospho-CoA kinase [Armatimonadota bacterium]